MNFTKYSPKTSIQIIGLKNPLEEVISNLKNLPHNSFVYAIGNQVGAGPRNIRKNFKLKYNG